LEERESEARARRGKRPVLCFASGRHFLGGERTSLLHLLRHSDEELGKYERKLREAAWRGSWRGEWAEEASSFVESYPRSEGQETLARIKRAIGKLLRAKTKQVLKLVGEETTSALLPLS
jgi:hypothetical protein